MIKFSKIPEIGVHEGMPADEYFSWQAFSKSMIPATMRSARHLRHYLDTDETTDAKILGSLVDALILEESELSKFEKLPPTYINTKGKEMPFTMASKSCKETYQNIIDAGHYPIKPSTWDYALEIKKGVLANENARKLIESGKKQVAIVWKDTETGVLCKGRIDVVGDEISDLKTTRNASLKSFARDVVNFGYHYQAGMYVDGWKTLTDEEKPFNFIAVENSEPYCSAVYNIDEEGVEIGRIRYKVALLKYADYLENDPEFTRGYSELIEPLSVPSWERETAFQAGDELNVKI